MSRDTAFSERLRALIAGEIPIAGDYNEFVGHDEVADRVEVHILRESARELRVGNPELVRVQWVGDVPARDREVHAPGRLIAGRGLPRKDRPTMIVLVVSN